MRLFVAVTLDRGLQRALARAAAELPELGRGRRGPVATREEQIHLTVRFLGETEDMRIADVIAATEAAAAAFAPFSFVVRGLGCFPKPDVGRVFWAGLEPCPTLEQLALRVERELRERGFPPEPRGFSPHVTLARVKGAPIRLAAPLDPERPRFGEQEVDELTVMESRPSPRGSLYVPVAHAPLTGDEAPEGAP
jgi:2'-5' RNA ligase